MKQSKYKNRLSGINRSTFKITLILISIIIIYLIFYYSLNIDFNSPYNNMKEQRMTVYNKEKNIKFLNTIQLEEKDKVIIRKISFAQVDDKGKYLLLTDRLSNNLVLYDINTGKIKKSFKPERGLSDTLAKVGEIPRPIRILNNRPLKYNTYEERKNLILKNKLDTGFANRMITNSINVAKIYNDKIFIMLTILISAKTADSLDEIYVLLNKPCLLITDLNFNYLKLIPCGQYSKNNYPNGFASTLGYDFAYNGEFYINAENEINTRDSIMDYLVTINKYDSNLNNFHVCSILPSEYLKSKIGCRYVEWWPNILNLNNQIYCIYPFSNKVYNITNNQKYIFKLYNLPYNNDKGFKYLEKLQNNFNPFKKFYLSPKTILSVLPLHINSIMNINNNIGILLSTEKINNNRKYSKSFFIQEYSQKGILLNWFEIKNENKYGFLKYATYNNQNKNLLIFRKHHKNGWFMESFKWK